LRRHSTSMRWASSMMGTSVVPLFRPLPPIFPSAVEHCLFWVADTLKCPLQLVTRRSGSPRRHRGTESVAPFPSPAPEGVLRGFAANPRNGFVGREHGLGRAAPCLCASRGESLQDHNSLGLLESISHPRLPVERSLLQGVPFVGPPFMPRTASMLLRASA